MEYSDHDGGTYWAPKELRQDLPGARSPSETPWPIRETSVTVKILEDVGIGYVLKFVKKLGIESPIKRDLSVALGTSGVSMPEFTAAFAAFANGGERVKPIFIKKVVTMKGEVLEENFPYVELEEKEEREEEEEEPSSSPAPAPVLKERVLSPQHAYIMTHLLEGVVQHGTGQAAKALGRPVAGKTGTSSDSADAWFIGYTPSLLAAVWVGFDDKSSIGKNETGARAALPIWISFMAQALRNTPVEPFKVPPGVTLVRVDLETGLPSNGASHETIMEAFVDGTLPGERTPQDTETPSSGGSGREITSPGFRELLPNPKIDAP